MAKFVIDEATLTAIAESIRMKKGTAEVITPEDMAAEILAIASAGEGGGFTPPDSEALDPDVVYATTRPADWLPMPTPGDDEIYLLGHIPPNLDGAFTANITYSGTCTVAFGNLVNGAFVAKETVTPTSGTQMYHTLYAEDYGDDTSDSCKQYIVRIKGGFTYVRLYPGETDVFKYGDPMIVDAIIGANKKVAFSRSADSFYNCRYLRYVRFVGNGRHWGENTLRSLPNLLSVSAEKKTVTQYMDYAFYGCRSLIALSPNALAEESSYNHAFSYCGVPLPKVRIKATSANSMFRDNTAGTIDARYIDTSSAALMTYFLYNAAASRLLNLNISSLASTEGIFSRTHLAELTFAGETTPGGWTIDLTYAIMGHKALVNMINSLPTATTAATLTITGNPGAVALTEEEIAVATAKNWSITI